MYKHILPNAISPIIVMSTQMIGSTVMIESGLSFLGVGKIESNPSYVTNLCIRDVNVCCTKTLQNRNRGLIAEG